MAVRCESEQETRSKVTPMKKSEFKTTAFKWLAVLLIAMSAPLAGAFNYSNTDLLLVFRRDGSHDMEFNIGSVSNFLNRPVGTTFAVTNWSLDVVVSNFTHLDNVKFLLIAATASTDPLRRTWLT